MKSLFFLYDELMTKEEQDKIKLNFELLSYGHIKAKLYWITDSKKKG